MGVPGDVVAPLLGVHAALLVGPRVADPDSLESGPVGLRCSPSGATRRGDQHPHPARSCASAQRQSGFSWEGVHSACGHRECKKQLSGT